ncbi:MAG TPA: TetR/AcrR family transcriptional regulator [Thermoleophilaceae bacterium]|nr:TetR/AcrR family transcriptional regulator [Thermoleophilaceae bacterium]
MPREVRERQLVELAEGLFAERGFAKASMDELARRAGVTKPVIYELFGSKEGLFRACLEGLALRLAEQIAEAARGADEASGVGEVAVSRGAEVAASGGAEVAPSGDPEVAASGDAEVAASAAAGSGAAGRAAGGRAARVPDPEARLRAGGLAFLRFASDNRVAYELLYEGRFSDAAVAVRRRQAALILELMREIAPQDVDPRELEVAAHAVNSAYEGVAHWMWDHPEMDVEQLADWTVGLLLPGLRRFT